MFVLFILYVQKKKILTLIQDNSFLQWSQLYRIKGVMMGTFDFELALNITQTDRHAQTDRHCCGVSLKVISVSASVVFTEYHHF